MANNSKAFIDLLNSLATVATSGDYNDLLNQPTIPAVIDSLLSTSATDALSANQGKVLKDTLDAIVTANRNFLLNASHGIWQEGKSFTGDSIYTADQWYITNSGTAGTKTTSRQDFALGQTDVPGQPKHYLRLDQTGAGNSYVAQRVENVSTLEGEDVTVSFYAKINANDTLGCQLVQNFGTGGSPSSPVSSTKLTLFPITTTWAKYEFTFSLPSISGKILGTDLNDYLELRIFPTNEVSKVFTFDISQTKMERGSVATAFVTRDISEDLMLCERFVEKTYDFDVDPGTAGQQAGAPITISLNTSDFYDEFSSRFRTPKRSAPTITTYSPGTGTLSTFYNYNTLSDQGSVQILPGTLGTRGVAFNSSSATLNSNQIFGVHYLAISRL